MPRQPKPENNQDDLSNALQGLFEEFASTNRERPRFFRNKVNKTVAEGDVTKRPMLPEEYKSQEEAPEVTSSTPTKFRDVIHKITQRLPFPSWMMDFPRSRIVTEEGAPKDRDSLKSKEEQELYDKEKELYLRERRSLILQSNPIVTENHPASCECGKDGKCATTQTKEGKTSRLPSGISKEEEEQWITEEAGRRKIPREAMKEWYEEQKAPSAIRIPSIGHPGGREPEEHDHLLTQLDHDPREECGEGGRNPLGHVVTIWNHDGAIPGFTRGMNIGMIVGYAPRGTSARKTLSPELVQEHRNLCGIGTKHKEGCPIKFHDDKCRGGEHAEGCKIPKNTIIDDSNENETLYQVAPFVPKSAQRIKDQHSSNVDFEGLSAPKPEWATTGARGLQGGIAVPSSRCVHIPTAAVTDFLTSGSIRGKRNPEQYFGKGGKVGPRSSLLTHNIFYSNPFSAENLAKLSSIPSISNIVNQLRNPGPEGVQPVESRLPGSGSSTGGTSQTESILNNLFGNKTGIRKSFTHVNENYQQTPSCRFCEDASYKDGKGPIVQTSTAPDGRPLYAHEECDNPFSFAEKFKFDFEGPNVVDVDFITLGSHNWGMGSQPGAKRINKELGIVTPSKPSQLVSTPFSHPGNRKQIGSMGLPEHEAAEGMPVEVDPMMQQQVNNLTDNGTAKPPR